MTGAAPVAVSTSVAELYGPVKVGWAVARNVSVTSTPSRQRKAARRLEATVRESWQAGGVPEEFTRWEAFATRMGLCDEPILPAPIILVRRVLAGGSIPRINNIVDAGNMSALSFSCPVGVFDVDRLQGPVRLRPPEPGEAMRPISSMDEVGLEPGELVYADSTQVFSRYSRDCDLTKVTPATTQVLCFVDGTPETPVEHVQEALRYLIALVHDVGGPSVGVDCGVLVAEADEPTSS